MSEGGDDAAAQIDMPPGCYMLYESDSGGKLTLHYSKSYVPDAIGFWTPGEGAKKIQGFKFNQGGGRSELIKGIMGGDANKRKYYSGWCQFIKAAKLYDGLVLKYPNHGGLEVDVYIYADGGPILLELDEGFCNVSDVEAVAALPKHNPIFNGVRSMQLATFLEKGNAAGASTAL